MDVYRGRDDIRLDERQLALQFGISRTPVREAMAQLEREGFVRSVPRRGSYVVRKSKAEVIEMITAWAALESMAARLITQNAGDAEIATLRKMFATFEDGQLQAKLDEYSEVNIEFHQTIIRMSGNSVLTELAANLFTHMRMIRRKTIGELDRADPFDQRSHAHHRGARGARHAARRGACSQPRARAGRSRGEVRRLLGLRRNETCHRTRLSSPRQRGPGSFRIWMPAFASMTPVRMAGTQEDDANGRGSSRQETRGRG